MAEYFYVVVYMKPQEKRQCLETESRLVFGRDWREQGMEGDQLWVQSSLEWVMINQIESVVAEFRSMHQTIAYVC